MITDLPTKRISALSVSNIYRSFTYKMAAKINWHRCEPKLRHCHPVYKLMIARRGQRRKCRCRSRCDADGGLHERNDRRGDGGVDRGDDGVGRSTASAGRVERRRGRQAQHRRRGRQSQHRSGARTRRLRTQGTTRLSFSLSLSLTVA